jgi:hypothetical protein
MSDKPISAGDLVYVAKITHCGCPVKLGVPFVVGKICRSLGSTCPLCGHVDRTPYDLALDETGQPMCGAWRLKRLDPDNLKDDVPTGEELTV